MVKMERRALLLSSFFSLIAMYLVYQYVSDEDEKMERDLNTFGSVALAARDILQFETIRPTDVEVLRVPKSMLPPGFLSDPRDVIDAVAAIPISKGEHLLDNKIISKNVYSGLDTQVAVGRRAISIPVNVKSSVGYMLRPGNRVDLAAHFEYKSSGVNISEVKVFLQDLLVLASGRTIQPAPPRGVDQNIVQSVSGNRGLSNRPSSSEIREALNIAKTDANYQTVTLEVIPEQAQMIVFVMSVFPDSILCFLRHSDDRTIDRKLSTSLYDVLGPESSYAKGPKAPPQRAMPMPKFFDLMGGAPVPVPK